MPKIQVPTAEVTVDLTPPFGCTPCRGVIPPSGARSDHSRIFDLVESHIRNLSSVTIGVRGVSAVVILSDQYSAEDLERDVSAYRDALGRIKPYDYFAATRQSGVVSLPAIPGVNA
jgi:hypothetical protein